MREKDGWRDHERESETEDETKSERNERASLDLLGELAAEG